ncbi:MAG TPA: hypothetical protein VK335_27265 [Bryobacteraceae bacterium]|nr:hypothetical protein [Bryobacteraceae bacterium]
MVTQDPLLLHTALMHEGEYHPLGFSLHVATNSPLVLRAAEEIWGKSKRLFPHASLEMRVVVAGEQSASPLNDPVYRAQQNLFVVAVDNQNFGVCDLERGRIFAWMTPAAVTDPFYCLQLLEWMVYFTIDHLYVAIIHAACVARNGRGLLLCGRSGAGKSCLTYACVKSGWTLVADDFCAPIRGRNDRMVIGKAERIRFRPEAASLFPELAQLPIIPAPNRKPTLELRASDIPGVQTSVKCFAESTAFLERNGTDAANVSSIPIEEALARIESDQPRWNSPVADEQREARLAILSRGAYVLRYGDFAGAIHQLNLLIAPSANL